MIIKASDVQHLQEELIRCGLSWDEDAKVLSIAKGFVISPEGFVVKA